MGTLYYAPDMHVFVFSDVDFGVVGVLRHKQNSSIAPDKPF